MANEEFTVKVSASEKRLLERLREQDLESRAQAARAGDKPFDLDDIKPGMTPEQIRRAAQAIRDAR